MTLLTTTTTTLIASCYCLLLLLPSVVQAAGVFELKLKSFANENGKDSLGKCCSGGQPSSSGKCPGVCRTRLFVCLKQYQANIDTTTKCTYGEVVTPVLGDSVLGNLSDASVATTGFANPIRFPFEFTWPGTFSLIVEAFHDNTDNATHLTSGSSAADRVIITRLATQRWLDVGPEWIEDEHRSQHSVMLYDYRVTCAAQYYGKGCEKMCRPRDDNFGHYRCSPTGEIVCLSGWKGDYCDIPHCLAGCDEQHGHCSRPNECTCHNGWTGPFCDQCVRYPGCLHGSCQKPWECLCDEGWGGLFCNQDLNFCTNHKPCRNGGTCFNTGQGSYTCACAAGFTGTDCETPILDCQANPCLNQGTCMSTNETHADERHISRRYKCACPAGWRGRHCEVSSRSCKDSPCARGATCEDDSEKGYSCKCPAGYTGSDCEKQIDECAENPCANGATCTDLIAGFSCTCPPGFSGERCQHNIDDCQGEPCLNGGTCVDLVNKFRCQCVPGYTGRLCQDKVDYCLAKPCANGGSCVSTTNDYRCFCKLGFSGKDCSLDVDECKSSPCQHGGTCRNRVNGFVCECPDGWRGETCSEPPPRAGYWSPPPVQQQQQQQLQPVAAKPEARHAALSTEHVVVIATISTAVPAFVLLAALAVMCMKRRQKREQAKADEEARLQNERNAVHSSMSKRAAAALCERPGELQANGDSHMIKNTWTAQSAAAAAAAGCGQGLEHSSSTGRLQAKSVNNAAAAAAYEDGYKPEPVQDVRQRGAATKQLNTEAAAHRASQQLYQKEKECMQRTSPCQMMDSKRASTLMTTDNSSCCSAASCGDFKRPNTSLTETRPPSPPDGDAPLKGSDTSGCGVYVIDDHYRHDSALAATLATEV
ncbi:neurogenic locus protein delta [Nasonia vitripennis]|uniref:Delta-like protein n=1 Tax=Nasonia vitripennis TaxID=7425 RepID=A0A7M7QFH4_NASVI|nr:neurogenic locus protein delta [Nasonia vitripennis]